jgi:outer membrane protein TolC
VKRIFVLLFVLITRAGRAQELSLQDAVAHALAKNGDLAVERESIAIAESAERRANAAYEPTLHSEARFRSHTDAVNSILSGAPAGELGATTRSLQSSASMTQLLKNGSTLTVFSSMDRNSTDSVLALLTPSWTSSLGAEFRQPLLQNRRIDPARSAIRIAGIDRARADASLRRVAAGITAATERAYWNLVAARAVVDIRESTLRIAEAQRSDTKVRVEAGTQAASDVAQTTTDVERRRGELVAAIEARTRAENALRNLIARDANDPIWSTPVIPSEARDLGGRGAQIDVPASIEHALHHRPELEELTHLLSRHDVDIESAVDRVRPKLDLIASYTARGLSGDENDDAITPFGPLDVADPIRGGIGRSLGTIGENRFPDASIGVSFSMPIGNIAAKEDVAIARAQKRQRERSLEQAKQQIAAEVRNAIASVTGAEQRIDAALAAREAAEIQLQAERDRFEAGATNNFFVLTRQNDLAAARVAEIVALTDYQKARSELARATGGSL